jgi:hypothetical protein
MGGVVEVLVEVGKSELWKRTWTEKAFTPPAPVGVKEPIRLLDAYACIVVVNWPAETGDSQE